MSDAIICSIDIGNAGCRPVAKAHVAPGRDHGSHGTRDDSSSDLYLSIFGG
jgi:hypothetical protein